MQPQSLDEATDREAMTVAEKFLSCRAHIDNVEIDFDGSLVGADALAASVWLKPHVSSSSLIQSMLAKPAGEQDIISCIVQYNSQKVAWEEALVSGNMLGAFRKESSNTDFEMTSSAATGQHVGRLPEGVFPKAVTVCDEMVCGNRDTLMAKAKAMMQSLRDELQKAVQSKALQDLLERTSSEDIASEKHGIWSLVQSPDCEEAANLWRKYGQTKPLRDMFATNEAKQLNAITDDDHPGFYAVLPAEVMMDPVMQKFGQALGDLTVVQALWRQLGEDQNRADNIKKALFVCQQHVLGASQPLVEFAKKAFQSLHEMHRQATPQRAVPTPPAAPLAPLAQHAPKHPPPPPPLVPTRSEAEFAEMNTKSTGGRGRGKGTGKGKR